MRFLLFFAIFFTPIGLSYVSAAPTEKSEGVGSVHHTPHPPHDHQNENHLKKLDESLKRSREEDDSDDGETH